MNPKEKLAALYAEAAELQKKGDDLTDTDITRVSELDTEITGLTETIRKADEAAKRLATFKANASAFQPAAPASQTDAPPATGSLGDRFVKSAAWRGFRERENGVVTGRPIDVTVKNVASFGGLVRKADPAPISETIGGGPLATPVRLPGITDLTHRYPVRLLDLITHGTASSPYVQYRQLTAITNNAAIVAEGAQKPLSTLTFNLASANAYTFADGFKVTNQELADDGIMASYLDTTLTDNLLRKVEDIVLNGTGSNQPFGILNTTGVLAQAFATDVPTTIREAITSLQVLGAENLGIVLNPTDAQNLSLLKDSMGRYLGNGPFGAPNPILWQIPYVLSTKVTAGTAVIGDFSTVQLLELEGLNILAFNQNEDDARHNLTYIRAEQRSLMLIRDPAHLCVATLHA